MKLSQLLAEVAVLETPRSDPEVAGIAYDSRRIKPGDLFIAIPGTHTDGHRYVEVALRDGAAAALVARTTGTAWPQVVVEDTRKALAQVSATFFGHPSRDLRVVGVTGTDGKTTTTILIHQMLLAAGRAVGAMNTIDLRTGTRVDPNDTRQTTQEALEIQRQLKQFHDAGICDAVIETSSHGLALHRVLGVEYDVAVFTNIAHEHLDFHHTPEAYREAKAHLIDLTSAAFDKGVPKTAVLNRDDPSYPYLLKHPIAHRLTYGLQLDADLKATQVEPRADGLRVEATTPLGPLHLDLLLTGRWNGYNALAAAAAGIALGLNLDQVRDGLEQITGVTGRMERVDLGQPFTVIIDYAHTPQSLEKVLRELRPLTSGKLIVVFGSAGERDVDKRAWMGEIAARLSDYAVFTNEDPREEDPRAILNQIAAGADAVGWREGEHYSGIVDRQAGITHAMAGARSGDTILLAGKGHEKSIYLGRSPQPWDERAAAEAAIKATLA